MRWIHSYAARLLAGAAIGLAPTSAVAQDAPVAAPPPCVEKACMLVIDWGPGKNAGSYGSDRRYGSGDDFEATVRRALRAHAVKLQDSDNGLLTFTLRPRVDTRALCDIMPGMNSSYNCVAMSDVALAFASNDSTVKAPGSNRLTNRCGGDRTYTTMTQFGQYAAEVIWFSLLGPGTKEKRPALKC